ncbi:MAG: dephospho-CoA kinase [Fimbriimonadaceae bacterium]
MIGITGGVAEGKSTVLQYLADLGYQTLSADAVARDVFDVPSVNSKISAVFGLELATRELVREKIAQAPFLRRALNQMMHGLVLDRILSSEADFVEVPLLIETCLTREFDAIWVVTCGAEEQLKRLTARLNDPVLAGSILRSQLPTCVKVPFADRIVRTNEPVESVKAFVQFCAKQDLS